MTTDEIIERMTEAQKRAHELARPLFEPRGVIAARRYTNESGVLIYSKVRPGTVEDLPEDEADCFLVHAFAVVEASAVRARLMEKQND